MKGFARVLATAGLLAVAAFVSAHTDVSQFAAGGASPGGVSGDIQTNDGAGGLAPYAGDACAAGDFVESVDSAGTVTCSTPPGASGGDSVTVNGSATTDVDLFDDDIVWTLDTGQSPDRVTAQIGAGGVDAITDLDASIRSGTDGTVVTGTAGADGNCAEWDANGDLVDSGGTCGGDGGGGGRTWTITWNSGTANMPAEKLQRLLTCNGSGVPGESSGDLGINCVAPFAGTWTAIYCSQGTAPGTDAERVWAVAKFGAGGQITCTISGASTSCNTTTPGNSMTAGEAVSFRMISSDGTNTPAATRATCTAVYEETV